MAHRKPVTPSLRSGRYLARCKDDTFLKAVANGHSAVFPESECQVKDGVADFFKDGVWVWSCNAAYAAAHFDLTVH